jgi:hypothetical protein
MAWAVSELPPPVTADMVPLNMGLCPVCEGAKYRPIPDDIKKYYPGATHLPCGNCGGQTMGGVASGMVRLRLDGTPCRHEYTHRSGGRCYHIYTCKHCSDSYDIDSGD